MSKNKIVFKNYGGSLQLKIENAEDLKNIQKIPEIYWASTSAPIEDLNCDPKFLQYIDTDKNGRIRTDEFKEAQKFLFENIKNLKTIEEKNDILNLEDLNKSSPQGKKLYETAKLILSNLNKPHSQTITLKDVRDIQGIMANSSHNGDGVITPQGVEDPQLKEFINDVILTVGGTQDASKNIGIDKSRLEDFFKEIHLFLEWLNKKNTNKDIMVFGVQTPQAYSLLEKLRGKIDEFFMYCSLVKISKTLELNFELQFKEIKNLELAQIDKVKDFIYNLPIGKPSAEEILHLDENINPLYKEEINLFKEKIIKPLFKEALSKLSLKEWETIKNTFQPYKEWIESKKGVKVESLGEEKLKSYLEGSYKEKIEKLIEEDLSVSELINQINNLEKLLLYKRWLIELANNFISFANLYNPQKKALFEAGTLIIENRQINFTMKVRNHSLHKTIAQHSHIYLLYVEITRFKDNQEIKEEIVAPLVWGESEGLQIGKRGIFIDRKNQVWDAKIIDLIPNPVSIMEAIKRPFIQIRDYIKTQIEKFTQQGQQKLEKTLTTSGPSGIVRDLLLGGGVALAALGSAFAYITKALSQVKLTHILGVILGIFSIIFIPAFIAGLIKIFKRDLSILLEANEWAVNANMKLGTILGKVFMQPSSLPRNIHKSKKDELLHFIRKDNHFLKILKIILFAILILGLFFLLLYLNSTYLYKN